MIRVMGNSPERRKIKDLNDVIYYRQKKDYTDQEFESKDLQKEIAAGRVLVLERLEQIRVTSADTSLKPEDLKAAITEALSRLPKPEQVSIEDIKRVITEALGQNQSGNANLSLVAETIRQELSGISGQLGGAPKTIRTAFVGPEYVPNVTIENLRSNIKATERTTQGDDVSISLEQLKKLKSNKT